MPNSQLYNLTPISNSISPADLFVVVDKSKLTTHKISLGELSDSIDGAIFLSSSYSNSSSLTNPTTQVSVSLSQMVISSSYTFGLSGSNAFAWSSSNAFNCNHCWTNFDTFEITASDDSRDVYQFPNGAGSIEIRPKHPTSMTGVYVIEPLKYYDELGAKIITSSATSYQRLSARQYEFEIYRINANDRRTRFNVTLIGSVNSAGTKYGTIVHYYSGGALYANGQSPTGSVTAITSSVVTNASFAHLLNTVISSSITTFVNSASGSGIFSLSSSYASRSLFSQTTSTSETSSNGPLPGMILLYAGVRVSGSSNWYNCDGGLYNTNYTELSASLQSKFTDGVSSNRLPKLSSNLNSGSGPFNQQVYISQSSLGHPTNDQISQSYGTGTIVGVYTEGTVYGTDIGSSGSAFYYNIKR
jgi:hypothetical protein